MEKKKQDENPVWLSAEDASRHVKQVFLEMAKHEEQYQGILEEVVKEATRVLQIRSLKSPPGRVAKNFQSMRNIIQSSVGAVGKLDSPAERGRIVDDAIGLLVETGVLESDRISGEFSLSKKNCAHPSDASKEVLEFMRQNLANPIDGSMRGMR